MCTHTPNSGAVVVIVYTVALLVLVLMLLVLLLVVADVYVCAVRVDVSACHWLVRWLVGWLAGWVDVLCCVVL